MGIKMEDKLEKELFELMCYMIISARNLDHEKKIYGPLRLVDATGILIDILEKNGIIHDEFFYQVKTIIEANKDKVMTNTDLFIAFLDDLILKMVIKLKEDG